MEILLKYKAKPMVFFGDGEWKIPYDLYVQKRYLFGLITKGVIYKTEITMFGSIRESEAHWDNLILNKTKLT